MAKNDFQYGGWNYHTLVVARSWVLTLISPGDCTLQCGMWLWNHDSEFTKWQHNAMWYVALGWHAVEFARWQHPALWQVSLGWHATEFAQTSAILEFYIWFQFWTYHHSRHVILQSSPVCKILFKSDHPQQKKMTSCPFSRWRISAILDFRGPIMGSLKNPSK